MKVRYIVFSVLSVFFLAASARSSSIKIVCDSMGGDELVYKNIVIEIDRHEKDAEKRTVAVVSDETTSFVRREVVEIVKRPNFEFDESKTLLLFETTSKEVKVIAQIPTQKSVAKYFDSDKDEAVAFKINDIDMNELAFAVIIPKDEKEPAVALSIENVNINETQTCKRDLN